MPKPFVLRIEIEEVALGSVMRKLNTMPGVVAIHMGLNEHPRERALKSDAGKPRKPRSRSAKETGPALLERLMSKSKSKGMTVKDMCEAFEKDGRAPHSAYSALHYMRTAGTVKLNGEGIYTLAAKKMATKKGKEAASEAAAAPAGA